MSLYSASLRVKIVGDRPLKMHNGQLANPMNLIAKKIKELTTKRKKTEEDYQSIAELEFKGGLYVANDGRVAIPATNLESCLVAGAKKRKLGEVFKASVSCENDKLFLSTKTDTCWPLIYPGPKLFTELIGKTEYYAMDAVVVNNGKVMRCRPIFREWSLEFDIQYEPDALNKNDVVSALEAAGKLGLCDHTPKFGRFHVEEE